MYMYTQADRLSAGEGGRLVAIGGRRAAEN